MSTAATRQAVVDLCVTLSRRGHLAGTGGNVALRLGGGRFAVTPSATDYLAMAASDICVLRLADLARLEGDRAPSVESSLHARVLRARPDVHCSIHTHQPVASACALLGEALAVPAGPWRRTLGEQVPVVGYAPSGTGWLAGNVARALRRRGVQACLMRNHGVVCCGPGPAEALQAVDDLEALARAHLLQRIGALAHGDAGRHAGRAQVLALWAAPPAFTDIAAAPAAAPHGSTP